MFKFLQRLWQRYMAVITLSEILNRLLKGVKDLLDR